MQDRQRQLLTVLTVAPLKAGKTRTSSASSDLQSLDWRNTHGQGKGLNAAHHRAHMAGSHDHRQAGRPP
jgi:hypothetical protein